MCLSVGIVSDNTEDVPDVFIRDEADAQSPNLAGFVPSCFLFLIGKWASLKSYKPIV